MKKNERLLNAIGDVHDEYLVEAENVTAHHKRNVPWKSMIAAAACICLIAAAVIISGLGQKTARAEGYVDIYYVGDNSEITSEPVLTELTSDGILSAWSEKNDVENVTMTNTASDSSLSAVVENVTDIADTEDRLVCIMRLNEEPNNYTALTESLKKTLSDSSVGEIILAAWKGESDDDFYALGVFNSDYDPDSVTWLFALPDGTIVDENGTPTGASIQTVSEDDQCVSYIFQGDF